MVLVIKIIIIIIDCINIHTGVEEHVTEHVTAIIKINDSPGALWNAIQKIGVSIPSCPGLLKHDS